MKKLNLDELFKKYPFIYKIKGRYYAFGEGICSCYSHDPECSTISSAYYNYESQWDKEISDWDAFLIYKKVVSNAEALGESEHDDHFHLKEKFAKMDFDENDIKEIEKQYNRMIDFFTKHRLGGYVINRI